MDDESPRFQSKFGGGFGNAVSDGSRPFVAAGAGVGNAVIARHILARAEAGDHQRPGMGNHIVHTADQSVLFDAEMPDDFQQGVGVVLAVEVRFQQVGGNQMGAVVGTGAADDGVGYGDFPPAADQVGTGAVAGEIVEMPRTMQPPQLLAAEVPLDASQGQAAHVAHIDPGPQHGQHMRIAEFGNGFCDFKFANSHKQVLR